MKRRTVLAGSGAVLSLPFGGCLSADDEPTGDRNGDGEDAPETQYPCYDVLELRAISLEGRVDWDGVDVAVVPSDDDRIADASVLRDLLDEAIAGTDTITYEHGDSEFDAVVTIVTDSDGVSDPIAGLPAEPIGGVPAGPIVRHENRRFVVESDTYRQCDE